MSLPVVFESVSPAQPITIIQSSGKIHSKFPKSQIFKGSFNPETKQLEGEVQNINPDLKTKFKIFKKRKYAAKMLWLSRIHRKLAPKIEKIRQSDELFTTV